MSKQAVLYCLGGLGVDVRLFEGWQLPLPIQVIPWQKPEKHETLQAYAGRLAAAIREKDFYLLGVSFGGIVAQEIARIKTPKKLFLISSLQHLHQIPALFRLAAPLLRLVPAFLFTTYSPMHAYVFGLRAKKEQRLLRQIIQETDPYFVRWALQQLFRFRSITLSCPILSMHGSADRLIHAQVSDCIIPGGGHFMLVDRKKEILRILENELSN